MSQARTSACLCEPASHVRGARSFNASGIGRTVLAAFTFHRKDQTVTCTMVCDRWLFREMIENHIRDFEISGKQSWQRKYLHIKRIGCIVELLPKPHRMVAVGDKTVSDLRWRKMAGDHKLGCWTLCTEEEASGDIRAEGCAFRSPFLVPPPAIRDSSADAPQTISTVISSCAASKGLELNSQNTLGLPLLVRRLRTRCSPDKAPIRIGTSATMPS